VAARAADESEIRAAWERRDLDEATTLALRTYGGEVYSLLLALHRTRTDADDAFSSFAERLWKSMSGFGFECSMRTWAYMIARRASRDLRRAERPRAQRRVTLDRTSIIGKLVEQLRTQTLSMYGQENRDAVARLRDELPEDDRTLLVLRVDRALEWADLARTFLDDEANPTADDLKRESARLRKRFQLIKERLLETGRKRGLLRGG
jgi:RNA polymerase sigma-70 factor, ECF subfamily